VQQSGRSVGRSLEAAAGVGQYRRATASTCLR